MGYKFNSTTGKADIRCSYDTAMGWVPYWNLAGKYVGMKFPSYPKLTDLYARPYSDDNIYKYEDLDW